MTRSPALVQTLTLALVFWLWGASALAEESSAQRAQPHVDAAQAAFNEEEYEAALVEFQAARELVEEPMLTYNIALCHQRLGNLREAIDEYNRYLREDPEARNAEQVRETVEQLHQQRVAQRDAPVEVEDADAAQRESRRGQARVGGRFAVARHELDVWAGTAVTLAPGLRGTPGGSGAGSAGFHLEFDYHYRINPTWHVGVGGLYDSFFNADEVTSGSNQRQFGGAFTGRWSHQFLNDRLEVRAVVGLGYEFVDRHLGENFHWIFLRFGGSVAYAIWHGFGVHLRLSFRMGLLPGGSADDGNFGGTFDAVLGVFWAFGG